MLQGSEAQHWSSFHSTLPLPFGCDSLDSSHAEPLLTHRLTLSLTDRNDQ